MLKLLTGSVKSLLVKQDHQRDANKKKKYKYDEY